LRPKCYHIQRLIFSRRYTRLFIQRNFLPCDRKTPLLDIIHQRSLRVGHTVVQLVEALRHKLKGRGFDFWWGH
jgi:hypothetical protein